MIKNKQPRQPIYAGIAGKVAKAIDRTVGMVAPGLMHSMQKARMMSASLVAYEGARITRTNPEMPTGSADAEILNSLPHLRALSRGLERDDGHVCSAINIREENVVGEGIRAQPCVKPGPTGMSQEECDTWNAACKEKFEAWAEECDATKQSSFYELQALACRSLNVDGEILSHAMITTGGKAYVEMIDSDRLESPGLTDTKQIKGGVEVGAAGEPLAYHILPDHPGDTFASVAKPDRFPRDNGQGLQLVMHVFFRRRPGQTRGVPRIAAAILSGRHLHHYMDSELIAARAASNIAMWIRREASPTDQDIMPVQSGEAGQDLNYHQFLQPGTVEYLNEGEEPVPFNPNRPGSQFDPFVVRTLRAISAVLGLSYEMVAKDFGRMNLASNRAMRHEVHRGFDLERRRINQGFNQPWYENVIRLAISTGELKPPKGYLDNPKAFLRCGWVAPAYGLVDPMTDIQAGVAAQMANVESPYETAAKYGTDASHILQERVRFEKERMKAEDAAGVPRGTFMTSTPGATQAVPPASSEPPPDPNEDPNADPQQDPNPDQKPPEPPQ